MKTERLTSQKTGEDRGQLLEKDPKETEGGGWNVAQEQSGTVTSQLGNLEIKQPQVKV